MVGAEFNPVLFRNDNPIILACERHQALILPVLMNYQAGGYLAGTVIAANTSSANPPYYQAYVNSGASGTGTAKAILFENVTFSPAVTAGFEPARAIVKGNVFQTKLTGLDANAITNLNARSFMDSTGAQILMF